MEEPFPKERNCWISLKWRIVTVRHLSPSPRFVFSAAYDGKDKVEDGAIVTSDLLALIREEPRRLRKTPTVSENQNLWLLSFIKKYLKDPQPH